MLNKFVNEVLIERKNGIVLETSNQKLTSKNVEKYVTTILSNIQTSYNCVLSKDIIKIIEGFSKIQLIEFYNELCDILNSITPTKIYPPMYKNFPDEVMSLTESELYYNAYMHYLGDFLGYRIMPKSEQKEVDYIFNYHKKPKVLKLLSFEDFNKIVFNLMSSSTSISRYDKEIIETSLKEGYFLLKNLPEKFYNKEVMIFVLKNLLYFSDCTSKMLNHLKTPTDILRFCVGLSDGDISLSEPTKFRNFKRRERRLLLGILNNVSSNKKCLEEMAVYKNQWIRLGEKLHPGDYKQFKFALNNFNELRNEKVKTLNSKIENWIESFNLKELSKFPGIFARNLDRLLVKYNDISVLDYFQEVAPKVSTNVLLQMHSHFLYRDVPFRVFLPKGKTCKTYVIPNELVKISYMLRLESVKIIEKTLIERFSRLEDMGKVYIEGTLGNYSIPFNQRSASKSLKTIARGSRINFTKDLRFYIYWKDSNERVDIDLTCSFLNENYMPIDRISYTHLKNDYSVHSGDITSAPNGASEFIDLQIERALYNDVKYAVVTVHSFTEQFYCDLPECYMGWMDRDIVGGKVYENKSVQNHFDLSSKSKIVMPIIIDLEKRQIIWCDVSIDKKFTIYGYVPNNIENQINSVQANMISMIYLRKTSIYTLLKLHALGRGKLVDNPDDADKIFSVQNGTHTDLDTLMGEYLI